MNKKLIRLTESDLHRIVKKSVRNTLNEWFYTPEPKNKVNKSPDEETTNFKGLNKIMDTLETEMTKWFEDGFYEDFGPYRIYFDKSEDSNVIDDGNDYGIRDAVIQRFRSSYRTYPFLYIRENLFHAVYKRLLHNGMKVKLLSDDKYYMVVGVTKT